LKDVIFKCNNDEELVEKIAKEMLESTPDSKEIEIRVEKNNNLPSEKKPPPPLAIQQSHIQKDKSMYQSLKNGVTFGMF